MENKKRGEWGPLTEEEKKNCEDGLLKIGMRKKRVLGERSYWDF